MISVAPLSALPISTLPDEDWSYDGITWTTVATISGQTGWGASETRVFTL